MQRQFKIVPPAPDLCQECAFKHDPSEPHNALSGFYVIKFSIEQGRVPTWRDALAHCDEETQIAWQVLLRERGSWTE